jgi:hypothetical protein
VDRVCQPCDERDHLRVVDGIDGFEVAGVEGFVASCHELE